MDSSSQFVVPTIIDVPELIVTNEDVDYDDQSAVFGRGSVWLAKVQFLGTALSYVVGLGNIWHFPYLCYKYAGGAFLVAYTLVLVLVGLPLFLMELAFGQYANEGLITIWRISPAFEGIGYSMCLISSLIALYYNLINSWTLHYLLATITLNQPAWSTCTNSWNGPHCFLKSEDASIEVLNKTNCTGGLDAPLNPGSLLLVAGGNCSQNSFDKIINTSNEVTLPANDYFHNEVAQLASSAADGGGGGGGGDGSTNWSQAFCLIAVWSIVFTVLLKNVRPLTSSPLILITLCAPYLSLFALFVRSITLPGASSGLAQYFTSDWERLQNIDIWSDAIAQVFFALSPCWGGIIQLANMNKFHNNFHSDAMLVVGLNYLTSLALGLIVFATLGFMSQYSGIKLLEVADSGIGLIFLVLPEALSQLPLVNVNSLIFFASLLLVGLASQLTVIETLLNTIVDTWPHKLRYRRPLVVALLCGSMLLLSLFVCLTGQSFNMMLVLDAFGGTLSGMLLGILELIAIAWVYGMENFMQDIDDMISLHKSLFPSRQFWYFMWRYLTPSFLFAVLLFCITDCPPLEYRHELLPGWCNKLGLVMTLLTVAVVPAIALIRLLLVPSGSLMDRISYLCRPSEDWAPSSYVSGPKLINRHQMFDEAELRSNSGAYDDYDDHRPGYCTTTYTSKSAAGTNQAGGSQAGDDDSRDDEDLKLVDGKAAYIIPEEDDDDDDDDDDDEGEDDNGSNLGGEAAGLMASESIV